MKKPATARALFRFALVAAAGIAAAAVWSHNLPEQGLPIGPRSVATGFVIDSGDSA